MFCWAVTLLMNSSRNVVGRCRFVDETAQVKNKVERIPIKWNYRAPQKK